MRRQDRDVLCRRGLCGGGSGMGVEYGGIGSKLMVWTTLERRGPRLVKYGRQRL